MRAARLVVPTLLLIGVVAACGGEDPPGPTVPPPTDPTGATLPDSAPDGVVDFGKFAQDHVDTPVDYPQTPPVGGPHNPRWQTCNFYDKAIPSERGVHSLEHGAVWITFDPSLPDDQLSIIKALADGKREVLASPFEGLPSPVVASAWGVQLQLETASDPRLAQFVRYYENGPQTPEVGVPCAQGVSDTL